MGVRSTRLGCGAKGFGFKIRVLVAGPFERQGLKVLGLTAKALGLEGEDTNPKPYTKNPK